MPRTRRVLAASMLAAAILAFASAVPSPRDPGLTPPQDPQAVALQSWRDYLQSIGWSPQLSERYAPRFLGVQTKSVANEHGGVTVTFDGSRPGVLATVTVVLDAAGKLAVKPVVQLADVLEAR